MYEKTTRINENCCLKHFFCREISENKQMKETKTTHMKSW